ncbi:MAG: hypothetical protein M1813_006410, partial [Trichoglossum hirsutum]
MPSHFRILESLGLRPKSARGDLSGVPPRVSRTPSPAPPALPVPQTPPPSVTDNIAFDLAFQQHVNKLSQSESDAFLDAYRDITPETLLSKVNDFDDAHHDKSMSRRCAEPVARFLRVINQLMGGVAIAIQSNPDISALVVGAVRVVIDVAIKFVTFFSRLTDMMLRLSDHLEHLAEYAKAAREAVAKVYGDLLDFCRQARHAFVDEQGKERKWASIRIFIRVQWEPFEASFGALESNIQHHLDVLLHSAHAVQLNAIRALQEESSKCFQRCMSLVDILSYLLNAAKERTDKGRAAKKQAAKESEKLRVKLLRWLNEIKFDEDHDTIYSKRYPDTGNWLVQDGRFQQWFKNQTSALLWCYGKPGAGKSVLAHGLNDKVGIAFAYIRHNSLESQQPSRIVSTFIKQLCWKKEQVPQYLLDFYDAYSRTDRTPPLDKYIDTLLCLAKSYTQIFLVIDALDECKQDEEDQIVNREQILGFVFNLADRISCAKVLVTSRIETDIAHAFACRKTPVIQIEARNVMEDITTYVNGRVGDLIKIGKLRLRSPSLKQKINETLITRAEGMFLWVNLQLINICKQRSDQDIEAELGNMPRGLDQTYTRALQQIQQLALPLQELARRCFVWVIYAERPLHVGELLEAVQIEDSSGKRENLTRYGEDVVIEACVNLLEVDNGFVWPIHFSVKEHFTRRATRQDLAIQEGLGQFFVNLAAGHSMISHSCLSYLMQGFLNAGPCEDDTAFRYRVQVYRLASYSSYFFDIHLSHLLQIPDDLKQRLKTFLSIGNTTLAAAMQLRKLRGRDNLANVIQRFTRISREVDASTLIHSTALRDHPYFPEVIEMSLTEALGSIHLAASIGLIEYVKKLVQEYPVDSRDLNGRTPLSYASENGHMEICRYALEKGADIEAKDTIGQTPLHFAARGDREAVVRFLVVDKGADVEVKDNDGQTPLHFAAEGGSEAVVRLLVVEKGADAEAKDNDGHTPLHTAAAGGVEAVVRFLVVEKGADAEAKDNEGRAPLHIAAMWGSEAVVRFLVVEKGADVEAKDNKGHTPLHAAAAGGVEAVVQFLVVEKGADVEAKDNDGWTALHFAANSGNVALVQFLVVEKGADVEAKDNEGRAPLHIAAKGGSEAVVRFLVVEKGADVEAKDNEGHTPLHTAAAGGVEAVVQFLVVEKGADVEAKDNEGQSPLHIAAMGGSEAVVQFLVVEKGADVEAKDNKGQSPLHIAAMGGSEAVVRFLVVEKSADVEAKDNKGHTPLHAAAAGGVEAVVQFLVVEKGADVEAKDNEGHTPLHAAAAGGVEAVVRFLVVEKGADVEAKDNDGWTALHFASNSGNVALVQFLVVEKGADVEAKDNEGQAPLHIAAKGGSEAVVQFLVVEKGADVEAKDNQGHTPLHTAAAEGVEAVVQFLVVEKGADVEAKDNKGQSPLHIAAMGESEAVVRFLVVEKGADAEAKDNEGQSPLHIAAMGGSEAVVRFLVVEKGADAEAKDNKGRAPLHIAAKGGSEAVVRFLVVEKGADAEAKDNEGRAPLHIAAMWGSEAVVRFLVVEKGADVE